MIATNSKKIIKHMSMEQIRAVMEILQGSADSYFFIFDLDADVYIIAEKTVERFPFESVTVSNARESLKKIIHPSDYEMVMKDTEECASGIKNGRELEYRWMDRNNKVVWIGSRGSVIVGSDGHRILVGRVTDLGRKSQADNLTGLRKSERLCMDVEGLMRDKPGTIRYIMRLGIDNFKEINEKEGMEAGNEVLLELAGDIEEVVGDKVDVYRLVADEFMIVDATDSEDEPEQVYERIRARITRTVREKEYSCFYTVSAGVMKKDIEGRSSKEILQRTEFALDEAKRNGRNQMQEFDEEAYNEYLRRLSIRRAMRKSVNQQYEGFEVYYQPIVSTTDGFQLIGAEALLRWKNEEFGNVSPAVFIPILEESGLIIPVGRYVMRKAAETCKKWQAVIPNFHVNVNLSYVQIHKSDLMQDVDKCIEEVGLAPESLVLELTESGYIEMDFRIKELFKDLKDKRIDLALDDFGTGYSNMRYLKEIEAKTVKIDRTFVVQALKNDYDYNLICHIIDMVHSLGSSVCMEGIEEKEELNKMMKTKPDMIQGYYFGKPSPEDIFERDFLQKEGFAG